VVKWTPHWSVEATYKTGFIRVMIRLLLIFVQIIPSLALLVLHIPSHVLTVSAIAGGCVLAVVTDMAIFSASVSEPLA
jgi:hypothetical protein